MYWINATGGVKKCVCVNHMSPEACCCSCGVVKAVGRSPDRHPGGDLGRPPLQRVQEDRMQVTGVGSPYKKLSVVEVQWLRKSAMLFSLSCQRAMRTTLRQDFLSLSPSASPDKPNNRPPLTLSLPPSLHSSLTLQIFSHNSSPIVCSPLPSLIFMQATDEMSKSVEGGLRSVYVREGAEEFVWWRRSETLKKEWAVCGTERERFCLGTQSAVCETGVCVWVGHHRDWDIWVFDPPLVCGEIASVEGRIKAEKVKNTFYVSLSHRHWQLSSKTLL